jgi:Uma2 family endonuclease
MVMGTPKSKPYFTVDQYLAIERKAKERHEYLDGEIYAMAGESDPHGEVTVNISGILYLQLRGSSCRIRIKDTKVRSGPEPTLPHATAGLYSYPDIIVVCGKRHYHDQHKDVLLNPTAIFEVLSESTEAFDRGEKFTRYQTWNPTLREYVLVAQDRPQIEHFSQRDDGSWSYHRHVGLDAEVHIASIRCTLRLAEVYEGVDFQAPAQGEGEV